MPISGHASSQQDLLCISLLLRLCAHLGKARIYAWYAASPLMNDASISLL